MGTLGQGIFDISDDAYHADPAPEPSLTRSLARLLIDTSPAHVAQQSPRLGGASGSDGASDEMDIGSAAHAMFLRGIDAVAVIPFPSYQSKEAKAQRDAARAEGRIPLKIHNYETALRIVDALEEFRARTGAFTAGRAEQTIIWQDVDHWARCKVDWLPDEPGAPLWDLKTTGGHATSQVWSRLAFGNGADMQAVHYARGSEAVRGEPPDHMRFCVIEQDPPYGIRVFTLSAAAMEMGEAKCAAARAIWVDCIAAGRWPGYADEIEVIEPPSWELRRWEHLTPTGAGLRTPPEHQHRIALLDAATGRIIDARNFAG